MATSKVKKEPEISANDLALYMVSTETTKLSIIRRNKYPSMHVMSPYQDVKRRLISHLADDQRDKAKLATAIDYYEQVSLDPSMPTSKIEDARLSKAVLEAFFSASNALELGKFTFREAPRGLGPLDLSGVRVKVNLDLVATAMVRGVEHGGGAILRLTRPEDSDSAKERRDKMGDFVAALVFMQVEDKKIHGLPVLAKICLAIDVQQQKKFEARAGSKRIAELKAACQFIGSMWATV
jgi:hypothetical protein